MDYHKGWYNLWGQVTSDRLIQINMRALRNQLKRKYKLNWDIIDEIIEGLPVIFIKCDMYNQERYFRDDLLFGEKNDNRYLKILKKSRNSLDELRKKGNLTENDIQKRKQLEADIEEIKNKMKIIQKKQFDNRKESYPPVEYCIEKNNHEINIIIKTLINSLGKK